jgi:hypothetical protein
MAERLERMMQQRGLGEWLRGNPGTAAEFDGQGSDASAMRLCGGIVGTHGIITIWRYEGLQSKV